MKASVLIPVKSLTKVKSRLSSELDTTQRSALMMLLFKHVVTTIKKSASDLTIFVVTNDPTIIAMAKDLNISHIYEKQPGHNRALTNAAKLADTSLPLLTISADLPFLTEKDITGLFSLLKETDAVIAPSKEETGTNALLVKTPLVIPYLFGQNSYSKFASILEEKHVRYKTYHSASLAFDIDTIDDLTQFKSQVQNDNSVLHKFYNNIV